jgi:putative NIF3 family GTP cyclohydrolase 1 type 2
MNQAELARRLSELFELERYREFNGWDFALTPEEKADLLAFASPEFCGGFNGLLCAADPAATEVERAYLLVFPERSLVDQVIETERERGNPGAIIVTHHPCDMETSDRGFLAIPRSQLEALKAGNIAIEVLHAPLDCHREISTSGALADGLGLRRTGTFAPYYAGEAGVIGEQEPESFAQFSERVRLLCELPYLYPEQIRFSGRSVSRIAIVAGGGDDVADIKSAEALGADTFLAGHWWTPHRGEWANQNRHALRETVAESRMNFIGASHDGSEMVVFRDRLAPLLESWGLEIRLLRQADHWR